MHGIALEPALACHLHAFAAMIVSAGVRLVPLGQTDGQRITARLEPAVLKAAVAAASTPLEELGRRRPGGRHLLHAPRNPVFEDLPLMTPTPGTQSHVSSHGPLRVGIVRPVGSGKTALAEALCTNLRDRHDLFVITNDIYTREDQRILTEAGALPAERIEGVETGGCPHTAIREDASINLSAIADMCSRFPAAELCLIESGGDNLAATFSPELADLTIYVIDVAAGD